MDDHALILYGNALSAKKKYTPVWKQEAKGLDGKKRFHGAFTGGFSAGYYGTVGSKEGWEPASFTSSRNARFTGGSAHHEGLMDEEDLEDYTCSELVSCKGSSPDQDKLSIVLDSMCSADNAVLSSMEFSLLAGKDTSMVESIISTLNHAHRAPKQSTTHQACRFTHEGEVVTLEKSYPTIGTPEEFNPDQIAENKTLTTVIHSSDGTKKETLSPEVAARALRGFMPFEHSEPSKSERYKEFLRLVSSQMDVSQFEREQQEFIRTAQIFQPLHGFMADKFVNPKHQASGTDTTSSGPPAFTVNRHEHRKSIEWSASPLLKRRLGVEQEDTPKFTTQPQQISHDVEEEPDSMPTRPQMDVLREIYSSSHVKSAEKVVFRKPPPKSSTLTKSGGQR